MKKSKLTDGNDVEEPGVREQNRLERMHRIKKAARELFLKKGYDGTTLRAIGARAGVGAGTIFGYVRDKRDLVSMLFNEDHEVVTRDAVAAISPSRPFLDQSIDGFRFYYQYFASNPRFALCILREWNFLLTRSGNKPSETARRHLTRIRKTIEIGRERGEVTTSASDDEIALLIYHIYQMESRRWMSEGKPELESGLKALRSMLGIVMAGFGSAAKTKIQDEGRTELSGKKRKSPASA